MRSNSILSNWTLMIAYTAVLVLGIIVASFLLAFYWRIDSIARVDPGAADYRADHSVALAPLSNQVVMAARRDIGDELNVDDPNPADNEGVETPLPTATPQSEATQTLTPTANPTASRTASRTPNPSATPTESQTETATLTNTLESTDVPVQDTPTPKPTKKPTSSEPKPTATAEPRPTKPPPTATSKPKPTNTSEPYPPPRPYP